MYLFTRAGRFAPGSINEGLGFAREMTERVRQDTGIDVHSWASTLSPDVGTVAWAAFVEDLQQLEEANDKLAVSSAYLDLVQKGSRLLGAELTDGVAQIVAGAPDPSEREPNYVVVARATAANGHFSAALTNGVEIAEAVTRITGVRTMFLVDATGPYGGCRWSNGFTDIAALERAESALMADQSWLELLDRASPAYAQGAHQTIYRRIG